MILLIDNYDSFVYNIVQALAAGPPSPPADWQAPEIKVLRNDALSIAELDALAPTRLIVSPGPCTPKESGVSMAAIRHFAGRIPILGICLGHQAIGEVFGGQVLRAKRLMHGKTSPIFHDALGIFSGLPNPFTAMRYHSLIVEENTLPDELLISARTDRQELMALRHKNLPIEGVQFHPESIMTEAGRQLLHTFLAPDYPQKLRAYPAN